jgi:hypothetical protein
MQALRSPASHGWHWIAAGFRLYRRNPPLLLLLSLNYWLSLFVILILPFVGPLLANIVLHALSVTVMNGCRAVDGGRQVGIDIVWSGFRRNLPALLRLGVLYLAGEVLAVGMLFLAFGPDLMELLQASRVADEAAAVGPELRSFLLAAVALTLPLMAAFWFAPLLIAWHDLRARKALFFSIVAVLRNWRPFVVYAAAALALTGLLPGLLRVGLAQSDFMLATLGTLVTVALLFVAMPTLFASIYASYRDVFGDGAANG